MSSGLVLRDATLPDNTRADVRIRGERIDAVSASLGTREGEAVLDLAGYVLLPAPAEPHAHLDKAYTADRFAAPASDLVEAIERWHAYRAGLSAADVARRARTAA
ncbi:MAG: cytosine deaminase, partial [Actinomycetota bacterium]|nr:cytosine deaminase [Actinomycetota bacterium]